MSETAFAKREGRYDRYGRQEPCTVYFFEDESGVLPLENLQLRMVRKLDIVPGAIELDRDDLFQAVVK